MSTCSSIMERRRRERIAVSISILVTSLDPHDRFKERAVTIDVSSNGAQLRLGRSLQPDTRLRIDILNSNRVAGARVICCDPEGQQYWRVRVQLLQQTGNFWGVQCPPRNWENIPSANNEDDWEG